MGYCDYAFNHQRRRYIELPMGYPWHIIDWEENARLPLQDLPDVLEAAILKGRPGTPMTVYTFGWAYLKAIEFLDGEGEVLTDGGEYQDRTFDLLKTHTKVELEYPDKLHEAIVEEIGFPAWHAARELAVDMADEHPYPEP